MCIRNCFYLFLWNTNLHSIIKLCISWEEWRKEINDEMESIRTNQVWDLVDLPSGRKAIGNKWVLKIKHTVDGSIERYKARLVAKWYTQKEGLDYEETFSSVVRFALVRLILAIVTNLNLELYQMDVWALAIPILKPSLGGHSVLLETLKPVWSGESGLSSVSPSYTWAQGYAYYPQRLGLRKGVATRFLGPGTNLDSIHKGTSLGLGPELRYVLGKVLGTQDHPALWLALFVLLLD